MITGRQPRTAISFLVVSHAIVLFAGFFAPYDANEQNRNLVFAPPVPIHFWDPSHSYYFRPFVYQRVLSRGTFNRYLEDRKKPFPLHLFVSGSSYKLLGLIGSHTHLFGIDKPAQISILGTDGFGRDEFSRLLYGGRISLFSGLLGCSLSLSLALVLGGVAGYYGRWIDELVMRASELFMTVPWLYLLLGLRAYLPPQTDSTQIFFFLLAALGILGWPRPARLIRGLVLSAKHRDYVAASKSFGASDLYVLRKHVLPAASSVTITQLSLNLPQYVLAEITMSFLGLGISPPTPSWGNMLAELQNSFVLQSCWWMFAPAMCLVAIFLTYSRLLANYLFSGPNI